MIRFQKLMLCTLVILGMAVAAAAFTQYNRNSGNQRLAEIANVTKIVKNTRLVGYGDSLMYGTGATSIPRDTWFYKTALATGRIGTDLGVGGTTSTTIADKVEGTIANYDPDADIFLIDGGYNNYMNVAGTVEGDIARAVAAINAAGPGARYIVLGIPTGESLTAGFEYAGGAGRALIDTINSHLATTYGTRFIDINAHLVARYNSGNPQDVTDRRHGIVPSSLRADGIHWNTAGQELVHQHVVAKLRALGWA